MAKRVAIVSVREYWDHGEHRVVATLSRGARGHLGEIVSVRAPVERKSDAVWRAECEGIDRGFTVRGPAR